MGPSQCLSQAIGLFLRPTTSCKTMPSRRVDACLPSPSSGCSSICTMSDMKEVPTSASGTGILSRKSLIYVVCHAHLRSPVTIAQRWVWMRCRVKGPMEVFGSGRPPSLTIMMALCQLISSLGIQPTFSMAFIMSWCVEIGCSSFRSITHRSFNSSEHRTPRFLASLGRLFETFTNIIILTPGQLPGLYTMFEAVFFPCTISIYLLVFLPIQSFVIQFSTFTFNIQPKEW